MPIEKKPRGRVPVFHTLLVFRCETTLSEALAEEAARLGTSISEVIRRLLVAGVKVGKA